jgi:hypothetical protein
MKKLVKIIAFATILITGAMAQIPNVKNRYSVTKGTSDSLQLVNDASASPGANRTWSYSFSPDGTRGFKEMKYYSVGSHVGLRQLSIPDTTYVFRVARSNGIVMDYRYDPLDNTTVDDSVACIVAGSLRYKLVVYDWVWDIRWFDAKCNGVADDTEPVKKALRLLKKYSNDRGGKLRLIDNKFDPTNLVYPSGSTVILLNGDIKVMHEWVLQGYVNLIGESGSNLVVQFANGPKASINTLDTDTSKAVLHLVGSGGKFTNFNITYPIGKGIWIDGWTKTSGQFGASNKEFYDIGIISADAPSSIPVLIQHAIWIYFYRTAIVCLDKAQYACKIQSVLGSLPSYKADMQGTGLMYFRDGIIANKGFYVGGILQNGAPVGNIEFEDYLMEIPDSAMFTLDSRSVQINNITIKRCKVADGVAYIINNRGFKTNSIEVLRGYTIGGNDGIATGDPIHDLISDGQPEFASHAVNQGNKAFRAYVRQKSEIDAINSNKGWVTEIFRNPFGTPENVLKTDAFTGYRDPSGNFTAKLFSRESNLYSKWNIDVDSGDYVFAGAWVKSSLDNNLKSYNASPLSANTINMIYDNGAPYMPLYPRTGEYKKQGWTLLYDVRRVNSVTGPVTMNFSILPDAGNPLLVWKPWLIIIKDSVAKPAEVFAWAKESIGNIDMQVPKGSRGIGSTGRFYIGDSTYWDAEEKKWFQTTVIPYPANDSSNRVATTAWVKQQSAGGDVGGSVYNRYVALISQSGTNAPTVSILENTLGGSITWARTATGTYTGILSGAFAANLTWFSTTNSANSGSVARIDFRRINNNTVQLQTFNSSNRLEDVFTNISIEVRVYRRRN